MSNEINDANSLGKGEVDSSILSGSTRNTHEIAGFARARIGPSATIGRTEREDDKSTRGKSVDSDRALFTLRAELTNRRNVELSIPVRERLTILINNVESLIRDPSDAVLEQLFRDNFARFEAYMTGREAHRCVQ